MRFYELQPAVDSAIKKTDIRPYVRICFEMENEDRFIPSTNILSCIIISYKNTDGGIINRGEIVLDNTKGRYTVDTESE